MGVVGCYHLGRRKSKKRLNWEAVDEVIVKSHGQEPAVFSLTLALSSAVASENNSRRVKGIQGEWKEFKASERSSKQVKGAQSELKEGQGEQNLKLRAKESENQIRAKQEKEGAWREEACANGCWGG